MEAAEHVKELISVCLECVIDLKTCDTKNRNHLDSLLAFFHIFNRCSIITLHHQTPIFLTKLQIYSNKMEWSKKQYNQQYENWMPWVEDNVLYYFTKDNKASYATKGIMNFPAIH